ncbi:MAG: Mn2+/Fe2+ NRAMP family transporter [Candidatus Binatia bacterium]|jgi:Mn2+/Fe2+ NRAMP family transporter
MSDEIQTKAQEQEQMILSAQKEGTGATVKTYAKLSGPGWLQSAITLGGGSLAGSLYLGIIGGYEMMWLQPLMMIFGIVMLSAISYVTLSTGEKPFQALNTHVNPVLGWGWLIASMMANLVWAMPQFSLGTAALQQNLGMFNFEHGDKVACVLLFLVSVVIVMMYDKGGMAYKVFDWVLKLMVALVVGSFFLVICAMATSEAGLPWGKIISGFVPKPGLLFSPAESLRELVAASSASAYWSEIVVSAQRDRMVAAAATAVGINMTFLLPYSMMKRGWGKNFRGLAIFDLSTGLFIPFLLATSCVVIAAATQFHANPEPGLIQIHQPGADVSAISDKLKSSYEGNLTKMLKATGQAATPEEAAAKWAGLPEADRVLASTLIKRDAFGLANSLENLAGKGIAQTVFGVGVVGMAVSSIIILMLINGFALCEMLGVKSSGMLYKIGCILPGITGAIGALCLWSGDSLFYLAVPTSRFGMLLLPIAYIAFFCLMNNKKLLGDAMPRGRARIIWNSLMGIGVALALIGAAVSILNDNATLPGTTIMVKNIALGLIGSMVVAGLVIHVKRKSKSRGAG